MSITLNDISKLKTIFLVKDEFFNYMDKLMKELETIRQEQILTPSHADLSNLEERVEKIEQQLFPLN